MSSSLFPCKALDVVYLVDGPWNDVCVNADAVLLNTSSKVNITCANSSFFRDG